MKKGVRWTLIALFVILLAVLLTGCSALNGSGSNTTPGASPAASQDPNTSPPLGGILGDRAESVNILLLLTVLTLLPSILIMLTGFTRIVIVLAFVRNGLGMQQTPPNQVLIGLALFLTFFVMSPVIDQINTTAYQPYIEHKITEKEAETRAMKPVREFMLKQTFKSDLDFFLSTAKLDKAPATPQDTPNRVLIPAFITSELKRGFEIGFFIYIPFIVIDMIVASVLMSMGMMMLPPVVISLPFKVLLFVLVDGWTLTVKTLLASFGTG